MEGVTSKLHQMRRDDEMCDVTVKSRNSDIHLAHSVILAAASPVFKVMMTRESFKEFQTKVINLPETSSLMVSIIMDYIYTGELAITDDIVVEIFTVAHQFQLLPLLGTCKKYIAQQMDASNCYGILKLGESYTDPELLCEARLFLLRNFPDFVCTEDFKSLMCEELMTLLRRDEIYVDKEEYLIDYIFQWIDHDFNERHKRLHDLLQCLRYPLMTYKFIEVGLKNDSRLEVTTTITEFRDIIIKQCFNIFYHGMTDNLGMSCLSLKHRIPKQLIFVAGGWTRGRTLDLIECYNSNSNEWFVTRHLQDPNGGRCYFGMEAIGSQVYVLGGYCGKMYMNTVRKFDTHEKSWSDVAPMHFRRCFTTTCCLDNEIYVIGGYDGARRLTSVEKFSPRTNQWMVLKSLNTPRSDCASCVLNNKIYLFGGYGGDSLCTCETYDTSTDTWQYLMQMQSRRSGACAVSLPDDNKIIVLGGFNGTMRVKTTEIYDPETNTWMYGPPMLRERSNFTTCLLKKQLIVIGGYTGHVTLPDVESLDLVKWKWDRIGELNNGRSAMKAVVLEDVGNMKEYFEGGEQTCPDGSIRTLDSSWPQDINVKALFNQRMRNLQIS